MNHYQTIGERAEAVALIAAAHAGTVDADARFPNEAVTALRELSLLGLLVPKQYGGPGASLADVALVCRTLGRACGSTALIYAMHQIQLACLVAGGADVTWQTSLLERLARDQLLLASVTSEVGIGGNIRSSICAPDYSIDSLTLTKQSSAISYGDQADALLVSARRNHEASSSDQILIFAERKDVRLVETGCWDTLGMRGTGSKAFDVTLRVSTDQILPAAFGEIAQHTMLPTSHLLWGAVWLGIASDAAERARSYLRRQVQVDPNVMSPAVLRFGKAASLVATIQARLDLAMAEYEHGQKAERDAFPLGFLTEVNGLKVMISEAALEVAQHAMMICGFSGYQCGTPYSVGRHLRDLQSAPLMVNNDRISSNAATMLIAQRAPLMRG